MAVGAGVAVAGGGGGDDLAVASNGVGVADGGRGVGVAVPVGSGGGVGVSVGVLAAIDVAPAEGVVARGVTKGIATALRARRGVAVDDSANRLKVSHKVRPDPIVIRAIPRQSPANNRVPATKMILYRFLCRFT